MNLKHRILNIVLRALPKLVAIGVTLSAFTIFAQNDAVEDPAVVFKWAYTALMHKQWGQLTCIALILLVAAGRKYGGGKLPFLKSKLGGVLMTLAGSGAGGVLAAAMAGAPVDLALIFKGLSIGVTAAGGWSIYKSVREHFAVKEAQVAGTAVADNPPSTLNQ